MHIHVCSIVNFFLSQCLRLLKRLSGFYSSIGWLHSLPTECSLLITFANSLDPDQARQNVGPYLDQKKFDTLMVFLKEFS